MGPERGERAESGEPTVHPLVPGEWCQADRSASSQAVYLLQAAIAPVPT